MLAIGEMSKGSICKICKKEIIGRGVSTGYCNYHFKCFDKKKRKEMKKVVNEAVEEFETER